MKQAHGKIKTSPKDRDRCSSGLFQMPACGGPKSGKKGKRMNETEIIQHPQIDGLRIFFDTVDYRTPHVHEEFELIWLMEGRPVSYTHLTLPTT